MLNLRHPPPEVWPEHLRKKGDGDHWPEPFSEWWPRHEAELRHLDSMIAEQWIHRHFRETYFRFIPLETLAWRRESWSAEEILRRVHLERDALDPKRDFKVFNDGKLQTALDFNEHQTWSMPPVVLETPKGVVTWSEEPLTDVRYVLVEGHKRLRYLAGALDAGRGGGPHDLFILQSPIASA